MFRDPYGSRFVKVKLVDDRTGAFAICMVHGVLYDCTDIRLAFAIRMDRTNIHLVRNSFIHRLYMRQGDLQEQELAGAAISGARSRIYRRRSSWSRSWQEPDVISGAHSRIYRSGEL